MHNLVKLVQASGKALVVPADAIKGGVIRTLERSEQEQHPEAACFIWLVLSGVAQSALVRERLGFILNKAGGQSSERVTLDGLGGTKISMPRAIFAHAIEGERIKDGKGDIITPARAAELERAGQAVTREDATTLQTNLHSQAGPVAFLCKDSAADLFDLFSAEVSDDDGSVEYDDDGNEIAAQASKDAPKKRAKA